MGVPLGGGVIWNGLFRACFRRLWLFRAGNQPVLYCRLPNGNEQDPNDLETRFLF